MLVRGQTEQDTSQAVICNMVEGGVSASPGMCPISRHCQVGLAGVNRHWLPGSKPRRLRKCLKWSSESPSTSPASFKLKSGSQESFLVSMYRSVSAQRPWAFSESAACAWWKGGCTHRVPQLSARGRRTPLARRVAHLCSQVCGKQARQGVEEQGEQQL